VSNQQSKWRDVDGTDHFSTHEQTACEELIIPCGEFGVLFVSAVLIVVVFLGGFSTSPTERNKSMGDGIQHFCHMASVWPLSRRVRDRAGPKDRRRHTHRKHAAGRRISIVITMKSQTSGIANS
jgi:hypothetical protein